MIGTILVMKAHKGLAAHEPEEAPKNIHCGGSKVGRLERADRHCDFPPDRGEKRCKRPTDLTWASRRQQGEFRCGNPIGWDSLDHTL